MSFKVLLAVFIALSSIVLLVVDSQQVQDGSSSIRCPTRCLCFRSTVRCMFLQLDRVPQVPSNTTILYVYPLLLSFPLFWHVNHLETIKSNLNSKEKKKKRASAISALLARLCLCFFYNQKKLSFSSGHFKLCCRCCTQFPYYLMGIAMADGGAAVSARVCLLQHTHE